MPHPSMIPSMFLLPLLFALAAPAHALDAAKHGTPDKQAIAEITALVTDFVENADKRDRHARFWADDLVYTSSSAEVTDKAAILRGFDETPAPEADAPAEPDVRFTAEDIRVRPYGDAAAVTFRLVQHAPDGTRSFYRNSGMLLRRDGRWEVVTWQATKVPVAAAQ